MTQIGRSLRRSLLAGARRERLAAEVYTAMVDNLYGTLVGYAALAVSSILLAMLSFADGRDIWTGLLLVSMVAVNVGRVVLMISYHRRPQTGHALVSQTLEWETIYAALGVILTSLVGLICGRIAYTGSSSLALIVSVVVVMGITGCIAGRNGSRPRIVKYQLATTFVPFVIALLLRHSTETLVIAVLIVVYYFAVMSSTRAIYVALRDALNNQVKNKDLTRRVKRSADTFDTALNNMTSGLLLFDHRHRLVVANESVRALLGDVFINHVNGKSADLFCEHLIAAFAISGQARADLVLAFDRATSAKSVDGFTLQDHARQRLFELHVKTIPEQGFVINIDDVTEKRRQQEKVQYLAHYDLLSGLPNRFSLGQYLTDHLPRASAEHALIVMYVDLDRFKMVNDELGHAGGDSVLMEVADRLNRGLPTQSYTARISGDEFVVVLTNVIDVAGIMPLSNKIIEWLAKPYTIGGRTVTIGASIGLALLKGEAIDSAEALRRADVALYAAKTSGRGVAVWFDRDMDDRARASRELAVALRAAIDGDELELHYQPIVDVRTGKVIAVEALSRWTHPILGRVSPSVFIPVAEQGDLIRKLGVWSLTRACMDAKDIDSDVKVAVNVSAAHFKYESISETVLSILHITGLDPSRLEVEITEGVLAEDLDAMKRELDALAGAGVSIALDDFGTGFSSLAFLHDLPIGKIKLDRSFITRLDRDASAISLIASIVRMAQIMGKQLVVEGVETAEHLALIMNAQATMVQGYYFSQPLKVGDVKTFIDASSSAGLPLAKITA